MNLVKEYTGCPCGTYGECCDNPSPSSPSCECTEQFCEHFGITECTNCYQTCGCNE